MTLEERSPELPRTVTRLEIDGRAIYLVGTAHVSPQSVEDVRSTLAAVQPDTVCVELCEPRYRNITDPESWRRIDVLEILRTGRAHLLLSSLIMTSFQRRIADKMGVKPGAEMLAAIEGAEASGAQLALVDRPIEVTMKRAGARLGPWTKIKVLTQLLVGLFSEDDIDENEIEKLKESEHLADAMQLLAEQLPAIKETLIDERDTWLAQKIRETSGATVVAVLGAGHVAGVTAKLGEDHDLEPLVEVPRPSPLARILKWAIPAAIIALLVYGFASGGGAASWENLRLWFLVNGSLSALGAAIALGHPLTILSAFIAAPLTSLNPLVAAGWVAGLVQAWSRKPTVRDLELLPEAILTVRGFWGNPVTRVLLVVALSNLGSMAGTFIAGTWIAARTL